MRYEGNSDTMRSFKGSFTEIRPGGGDTNSIRTTERNIGQKERFTRTTGTISSDCHVLPVGSFLALIVQS